MSQRYTKKTEMPNKFVGLQILLYLCTAKVCFPLAYFLPDTTKSISIKRIFRNMKRKILTRINLILGTLSLALAGCHTQKNTTNADNGVVALYGITVEDYQPVVDAPEQNAPADSILPLHTDSVEQTINDMPRRDPQIMVKYGVMRPRK